jgi:hypothetical protein
MEPFHAFNDRADLVGLSLCCSASENADWIFRKATKTTDDISTINKLRDMKNSFKG